MFSKKLVRLFSWLVLAGALALPKTGFAKHEDLGWFFGRGAVFTMNNSADGNRVLVYERAPNGHLKLSASYPTGGFGTSAGLGNQGGLVMSDNQRWMLAVNAGSDEISVFEVAWDVLILTDVVPSGGENPVSLTIDHDVVYVLNAGGAVGGSDSITGFHLTKDGRLEAIADSTQGLSAPNVGPAQVGFAPGGGLLLVTEKGTNMIDTFVVDSSGKAGPVITHAAAGQTPFGFAFGRHGQVFVSEAFGGAPDASTLSSYQTTSAGGLTPLDPTVPTTETAACWVVLAGGGRYAYTTNSGSGTISGFSIASNGALSLLDSDGVTGVTGPGSAPIDMSVSADGRYLYSLNSGTMTITGYRIRSDGSLQKVEEQTGIPAGADGLVAR